MTMNTRGTMNFAFDPQELNIYEREKVRAKSTKKTQTFLERQMTDWFEEEEWRGKDPKVEE